MEKLDLIFEADKKTSYTNLISQKIFWMFLSMREYGSSQQAKTTKFFPVYSRYDLL